MKNEQNNGFRQTVKNPYSLAYTSDNLLSKMHHHLLHFLNDANLL